MIFTPFSFVGTQFDPDALKFLIAAEITNGTEQVAINNLVLDLKSNSLWTKMYIIYPFVGGTSTSTKYNLKDTTTYSITWNGGITFSSNGVLGNGSTGYGQTGWIPKVFNSGTTITGNLSLSVYSRTSNSNDGEEYGVANGQPAIQILCRRGNGNALADNTNSTDGRVQGAVTNSQGFFIDTRTSSTVHKLFRNGTQVGTTNTTTQNTNDVTVSLDKELFVLAQNNNGTTASYSTRELAFMHVGAGLSDSEVTTFNTLIDNFEKTLKRNV